jgi:DNA-binding CsgD family transcriptional regulator
MANMDSIDVPRVLSTLGLVAEAATTDELLDAVLEASVALVHADSAVMTEVSAVVIERQAVVTKSSAMATGDGQARPRIRTWPEDFLPVGQQLSFDRLNHRSPWPLATHTPSGDGRPLRIADRLSHQHYRGLEIYGEPLQDSGFDHQVAFSIPIDRDRRLCVTINRHGGDFSKAELDRLEALRRPVAACASHIALRERFDIPGTFASARLTPRERDVLTLVATGLSNTQIGLRLGISARTVNKHLEHIFTKTGLSNRTQVAACWPQMEQQNRRSSARRP